MTDLAFLKQFTGGNPEKMKKYIGIFLQTAPEMLDRMEKALADQDVDTIRITAHSLKPQMAYMGIHSQEQAIKDIESYAGSRSHAAQLPNMIASFNKDVKEALKELQAIYNQL